MNVLEVISSLQSLLDLGEEDTAAVTKLLCTDMRRKAKTDFFKSIRIYKNRLDLMCTYMYNEIEEFDPIFRKKMGMWHIGETNAFKDLLQTYTAKAYRLGVLAAKKDLQKPDFSTKVLEV